MSAVSQNGWPVSPNEADLDITPLVVGGVAFSPGVRGGKAHEILSYVAHAVHTRVQKANSTYGCWGYSFRENVNSPGEWSNHASATAIDYNATLHGNGVPTAQSWTPAQIAEIHKILDEVDNVVRWGGDYEGTPDSMHFEINVPPSELDVALPAGVPKAGDVWNTGYPHEFEYGWNGLDLNVINNLPELTAMSVSYPTMMAATDSGRAYWVFRPTQTGRISIDALLSHHHDAKYWTPLGPYTGIGISEVRTEDFGRPYTYLGGIEYEGSLGWFEGGFGYPERNQGRIVAQVEAGKTYVISTSADTNFPWVRTVVRISDFAPPPPAWVQPPDQKLEYLVANSGIGPNFRDDAIRVQAMGFTGNDLHLYRGFGGPPNPVTDSDARECGWRWARRMWANTGVNYWTPGNMVEWNGGPGACPSMAGKVDMPSTRNGFTVGYYISAFYGVGGISDFAWQAFAGSYVISPTIILQHAYSYLDDSYLPALSNEDYLEFEPGGPSLVDLKVRWAPSPSGQSHDNGVIVKWYMGEMETEYDSWFGYPDHPSGRWGPWGGEWWGQSGDTPENWAASQTHMGDSSGYDTGSWKTVPPEWYEGAFYPDPTPSEPGVNEVGNIRLTALFPNMLTEGPPPIVMGGSTSWSYENYKSDLRIETSATLQPARYRVIPDPGIADLAWAGVGAISVAPTDAGQVFYDKGVTPVQHGI